MSESVQPARPSIAQANRLDLGIVAVGVVVLIASLMPYYTIDVDTMGLGFSDSTHAWHGFFGWFGALAAIVGSGLLAAHLLGVDVRVPVRTAVLAAYAVAVLCTVIALFVYPGGGCDSIEMMGTDLCDTIDLGRGIGYWIALLATIAGLALAVLRRDSQAPAER